MTSWTDLLFRESAVEVFLHHDDPGATGYPEPYLDRVTRQLEEAGLLEDGDLTEEGETLHDALRELLSGERDEIDRLRERAEDGVSVVERGRILRRLSALERTASDADRERIAEVRNLLDA